MVCTDEPSLQSQELPTLDQSLGVRTLHFIFSDFTLTRRARDVSTRFSFSGVYACFDGEIGIEARACGSSTLHLGPSSSCRGGSILTRGFP